MKPILFLNRLFSRKRKPSPAKMDGLPPIPPRIARLPLSIHYWQARPDFVEAARKLHEDPVFRDMMTMLFHHIPRGFPVRGEPITETQVAIEKGRTEGFFDALQLIEATTRHAPMPKENVESTFGMENGDYQ